MLKQILPFILFCLIAVISYGVGLRQNEDSYNKRVGELAEPDAQRMLYGGQQSLLRFYGKKPETGKEISGSVIGTYAEAMGSALDKPEGYKAAYYEALNDYEARIFGEDSVPRIQGAAAQADVELQLIQIEQNRKIIQLLQKIAKS